MLNKILCVIILGTIVGLAPVGAQTAPAAPARIKGKIVAARVEGHVTAVSKVDGATRVLHDGDYVTDQTEIVTAVGANVILSFSNGATVNVAADSTLDIDDFEQDPFAAEKVSDMTQEPGTSITKLNLTKGELVGKVVHLNVDRGSEFTVQTPVGAAGIRGTTFRIVFRPAPGGKAFFVVTTADGTVVFRGVTSAPVDIPAGKQVVATFNYTPASTSGGVTTPATASTPLILTTTDVSATESAAIQVASQAIVTAVVNQTFAPSGAGGGGGNGGGGNGGGGNGGNNTPPPPDNTPPNPANPLPDTTPGAGTGL
jgi:hypothetical protein